MRESVRGCTRLFYRWVTEFVRITSVATASSWDQPRVRSWWWSWSQSCPVCDIHSTAASIHTLSNMAVHDVSMMDRQVRGQLRSLLVRSGSFHTCCSALHAYINPATTIWPSLVLINPLLALSVFVCLSTYFQSSWTSSYTPCSLERQQENPVYPCFLHRLNQTSIISPDTYSMLWTTWLQQETKLPC